MADFWNDRFMWSGEIPLDYPDLNPVAFTRMNRTATSQWADEINSSHVWRLSPNTGSSYVTDGFMGNALDMSPTAPATQKNQLTLDYFNGLWPSSGKLLVGMWCNNRWLMGFAPLMSTRGTSGQQPLFYLSAGSTGTPRQQVYSDAGSLLLDNYETTPWMGASGWIWYGQLIDLDNNTTQFVSAASLMEPSIGPVRALGGTPNKTCRANLDVMSLQASNYWSSGVIDELMVAHPGDGFDVETFARRIARGTGADAQGTPGGRLNLTVSDSGVYADNTQSFETGVEQVSWVKQPEFPGIPDGSVPSWSFDNGATWESGTVEDLPESFAGGLLKWTVMLPAGTTFTGADVEEPTAPPPTLGPLQDVAIQQNEHVTRDLVYTITGPESWIISHENIVDVVRVGNTLSIDSTWTLGSDVVTVTLTDEYGQTASRSFAVEVTSAAVPPPDEPKYPRAPIILWDEDEPDSILAEPLTAVVEKEKDGKETFDFSFWADDPLARLVKHEERVSVAGDTYRMRRVTDEHVGGSLITTVYAEALFYDLATEGTQIDGQEFTQVSAGNMLALALESTSWTVGQVNVSTLRTYKTEDMNPLEFVRFVQSQHGGELIFDNEAKTVNLYTSYGQDKGVTFFYGHGLSQATRVVDTTSLVTRIYAKNADGVTIAGVNNGVPYVEDYSYTAELKSATYDFKEGTNPYTMLQMALATLAHRSQPDVSYEVKVDDLSYESGNEIDRFNVRDYVRVVDEEIDLNSLQQIVGLKYDIVRPWNSELTLSGKLKELGSSESVTDAGVLTTGSGADTFDLVPFNLLKNGRFDNQLNHWARYGVVVEQAKQGTGDYAAVFRGSGTRWLEQTVQADNRDSYALSFDVASSGGPSGWVPDVQAEAVVTFEDGSTKTIQIDLA